MEYPVFQGKYGPLDESSKPSNTQLKDFWKLDNKLVAFSELL